MSAPTNRPPLRLAQPTERRVDFAIRDAEAAEMRAQGLSYTEIGARMGITKQSAHSAVKRALRDAAREPAADLIQMESERLDALWKVAWEIVTNPEAAVDHRLGAIDRGLRVMDRRAKLLGLDAPTKIDARITDALDAQIEALAAEVGRLDVPTGDPSRYDDEPADPQPDPGLVDA